MVLCASPPGLEQAFRCQHRDLIFTRSAYDHKRVRPFKPMVGSGQISGVLSPRTGGPPSYAKVRNKYKKPTSVVESYKTTYRNKRKCNRSSGVERTSFNTATTCDEFYFSGNKPQTIPKLDGRERSAGSLHPLPDGNGSHHGKE